MRGIRLTDELYQYVLDHSNPPSDPVSEALAARTEERFGRRAVMNVGQDQGRFLESIVAITGSRTVVEVGTFTGMSALWLARGLPAGGRLTCFELVDDYAETAREAWCDAGVDDRIELRFGPAADGLAELPADPHIDLAFVDADKPGYLTYLDLLLPRMRDDGAILVDNTLWSGAVVDGSEQSPDTIAIREFNDAVASRDDCDAVILTIGDGVTLIRPRRP